jgi:hypothetical protein
MAGHRSIATIGGLGLAVVAVAVLAVGALRWSPEVPGEAAQDLLAETVMTGAVAQDVEEGTDIAAVPRSPAGGECLTRIDRASGYMDVCWRAYRHPADSDPDKDYYLLVVSSTFGSGSEGSPRWAMLKADLVGSPADHVLSAWPDGEFDGSCEPTPVPLSFVDPGTVEVLCGHIAPTETDTWARAVTWTCRGCLLPDDHDRALSLYVAVGVTAGTVPVWRIFGDVGG